MGLWLPQRLCNTPTSHGTAVAGSACAGPPRLQAFRLLSKAVPVVWAALLCGAMVWGCPAAADSIAVVICTAEAQLLKLVRCITAGFHFWLLKLPPVNGSTCCSWALIVGHGCCQSCCHT